MSKRKVVEDAVKVVEPEPFPLPDAVPDAPPVEVGPPFYASEYIFATESGVRTVKYAPVGAPQPAAPEGTRLIGTILSFPFASESDRAKAIG